MTLLVLADSSAKEERLLIDKSLLAAVDHFGMPLQVLDLAVDTLSREVLEAHSAVVLAQRGLGHRLSESQVQAIKEAVEKGVGLVSFDGMLADYPAAYSQMLGVPTPVTASTTSVRLTNSTHPIARAYDPDQEYALRRPVAFGMLRQLPRGEVFLRTKQDLPAAFAMQLGKGRIVQFTLSPDFWRPEYFGHVHGLDGLFWRSIVWAARKPFVMMAMPPFVTARIDDASGSGSGFLVSKDSAAAGFRYIDALNKYGFIPNVGLFTDDIKPEDGQVIKQKYDRGLAEFSAHAWTNDRQIYNQRHLRNSGAPPAEFSTAELRKSFAKLDRQFATWGIKPSRTVNSHFFNPGINSLPFLKERGETFLMFAGKFGKHYYDPTAYAWDPKPYRHPGFTFDYMPDDRAFFNVEAHPYVVAADGRISDGDIDCLWSNTTFGKEHPTNDLDAAARKGAYGVRLGLDSLFFGCLFTHEQRIAVLTVAEWEKVVANVAKMTARSGPIFKSYDYISEYAKSRYDTKIIEASQDPSSGHVQVAVVGKSALPLILYVFAGDDLEYRFQQIPAFQGKQTVAVVK
jgi:type 1 glutamine amidotransferase